MKSHAKATQKVVALKSDCGLFSHLYIACQTREGNLDEFFCHENQPWPPSISENGEIRPGKKSDLVKCLEQQCSVRTVNTPSVDATVVDGAVIVQMLPPGMSKNFQEYSDKVFVPYILKQLEKVKRIDVVWDVYRTDSLKQTTRQNRGTGQRRRVTTSSRIPTNWKCFLRSDENKTELFEFLAKELESTDVKEKELLTTYGRCVLRSPSKADLKECTHEEGDTRLILHAKDASECGHRKIMVKTIDTDVVVVAVASMKELELDELWKAFGTGKLFRYIPVHKISDGLGAQKSFAQLLDAIQYRTLQEEAKSQHGMFGVFSLR